MKTIVQVPMDSLLRQQATQIAKQQGFSSVQDLIRFLLKQISSHQIQISVRETSEQNYTVSSKLKKTIEEAIEDEEQGKIGKLNHVKDLLYL